MVLRIGYGRAVHLPRWIDRCGDAGPAGADDADVKSGHVVTQVFHAIQNLRIGVSDTRARITG